MHAQEIESQTIRAGEMYGDFWFNAGPVLVSALRGQVVLVEFWDYTDGGSIRTLPYVTAWSRKYAPFGLVVIGVHSPRFPFGKDPENVRSAITRFGIPFPVVMDNEQLIAARYDVRSWPTMVLIDKDGFIRYRSSGDGGYGATEHAVQTLLYGAGVGEELPLLMEPLREADRTGAICYRATPDIFAGYLRGSIGNVEGYNPESVLRYADPGIYLDGRFYADGVWMNARECLRLESGGEGEGRLIVEYQAAEVNAVMEAEGGPGLEVTVRQDDRFLDAHNKGEDIVIAADGRSYLRIDEPRSYGLVRNREYGEHTLKLSSMCNGLALYAFTFVSSVIPEQISRN